MDKGLDYQFLLVKSLIDDKNQASVGKINKYDSKLDEIKTLLKNVLVQNQNSFPEKIHLSKT